MPGGTQTPKTAGTDQISTQKPPQDRPNIRAGARSGELRTDSSHGSKIGKKLGLSQRTCENLSQETQKKLNASGKVNVKWYTKLGLKLGAFFARGVYKENYKNAKGEWRAKAIIADKEFLNDLAEAVRRLDGKDFNDAFEEIYKLLGGDTSNRGNFFIKQLLIPCLQEIKTEVEKQGSESQGGFDKDTFIGLCKKYSDLNKFCLGHKMTYDNEACEQLQTVTNDKKVETACQKLIEESTFAFFEARSDGERKQHLADMCIFASVNKSLRSSYGEASPVYECMSKLTQDEKFGELLKCFGEGDNRETQIINLKKLIDELKSISDGIIESHSGKDIRSDGTFQKEFQKKFREKLKEYFSKNDSQMWMIFKVMDANASFVMSVVRHCANFPLLEYDSWPNVFSYVAMEKIKSLNKNSNKPPISSDKAKLLLQTANLPNLIDSNKIGDIVEFLKFAQKNSLPFENIFPPDIELSATICIKLLAAVSKENDGDLKDFCLEGIKQRLMPKITLAKTGDRRAVDYILNSVKDLDPVAYTQLYSAIPEFGDAVKGCIKGKIDKCIGAETNTSNLKELFYTLEKLEIANLSAPDTKGKFGFSLNDILGNAGNQIEQLKTSIKTATNASLEKLVKPDNISAVNLVTFIEEIKTLLYLLENLRITNLSNTSEKGKFGLSLEDILGNAASQQIEKLKTSIKTATNAVLAELANVNNYASYTAAKEKIWALLDPLNSLGIAKLDDQTTKGTFGLSLKDIFGNDEKTLKDKMKAAIVEAASRSGQTDFKDILLQFGINEGDLNKQERKALGIGSTPA